MTQKGRLGLVKTYYYGYRILGKISSFSGIFRKPFQFISACYEGLWLGILRREDFHLLNKFVSDKAPMWTSEEYNKSGLHVWEKEALDKYFHKGLSLIVIAAGGGREVLALRQLGYVVDGFECDPRLVDFANQLLAKEGVPARVELVARDHGPNNGKIYNGAIVGWGAYMLVQGESQRIALLRELRNQLRAGDAILLSFFTRSKSSTPIFAITIANGIRGMLGRDLLTAGDALDKNFRHRFIQEEVVSELKNGGFKLEFFPANGHSCAVGIAC